MKYIIILLCILLIPLINMNTKETFIDINCNNKNDILGYNTDYIDNKFHPDKYIKIDNQLNFNMDNTKYTLDPKILLKLLKNLKNKNILGLDENNYNTEVDYDKIVKDIDYINTFLIFQIKKYFKLYVFNTKSYNCDNPLKCEIKIYDYYIYSVRIDDNDIIYDLQYIFDIFGSEYKYVYRMKIKRCKKCITIKKIDYEGISTVIKKGIFHNNYSYYDEKKDPYTVKNISELLELENINTEIIEHFNNKDIYKCYNSYGINKYECENNYDYYGKKKKSGKWDIKCVSNEECPFYKANKNYENDFGGCINGFCELPLNMDNISPHFFNDNVKKQPYCYSYKNGNYESCHLQNNKELYPNLISPDYAFKGDLEIREVVY